MIQVCAQCGTRWNVRDRRRAWCPRCNGALLPPTATAQHPDPQWGTPPAAAPQPLSASSRPSTIQRSGSRRIPPGYRWIAVRPGAAPPPRRRRRPLGPTPRYQHVPGWGLVEHFDIAAPQQITPRSGPSAAAVRATLITTMTVLGAAAVMHVARYALLLINRTVLLDPVVAWLATWLGVAISVAAVFAVVVSAIVLTNWLIARRSSAFLHRGLPDPRPAWMLRAGCWIPLINLSWAPVFVLELAAVEDRLSQLRRPIVVWWVAWVCSTVLSVFAIATSFTSDVQGIADNTVTTTVAYLLALAAVLLVSQVVWGFERTPVERVTRRWVIVADESPRPGGAATQSHHEQDQLVSVERAGQNPAA